MNGLRAAGMGILLALGAVGATAGPEANGIQTRADVERWLREYHVRPRPELTVAALRVLERERLLEQPPAQAALAGFLSEVFRAHPDCVAAWGPELDALAVKTRRMVWLGLWLAGTPPATAWLQERAARAEGEDRRYLDVLLRQKPFALLRKRIVAPVDVDLLWGAFMANGKPEYLKRIIALLPWCHDLRDLNRRLVGESARWLLTNQAGRHPQVRQLCEEELGRAREPLKTILEDVLRTTDELAGDRDGH